ncbi:hypothetical protein QYE76_031803 [Lolium multiflorum]|uniref:Reverse transcriptase domain-containing protein n=1 Tax=Lolium multiflorum TaxID=4521 RepID=A0AAD8QSB8_LOLMU|nr:hypothetical protein QYE76_031803 [Lolium multiflorum]
MGFAAAASLEGFPYRGSRKNFDKYHEPYKDKTDSPKGKCIEIKTVDHVLPEAYIEKTPFPAKMKEYFVITSVVNKSAKKPIEPEEQIKVEPDVAIVKDLVTENVEDGHIIFCEDASNIVSHPNKYRKASVPVLSVGDHCYYGLCDIGASISDIPYELYTEIMHEIGSCELEDIDVVIRLANRETISPIGIVRDVEVLCGKIKYPADFLVLGSAASKSCPIIFGRPFLNTCGAIIDCKKEKIVTKFAGESYEFNFSKFAKTPYKADLPNDDFRVEQCASIALAPNNPLQQHLENSESEVFREERDELDEIFLRQPILKHDLPVEDLGVTPPPKEDPVFDLKPLPDNLKYAYIDDKKTYPVIISSKLSDIEEERLLEILKKHRGAIDYTLDDLKGISPAICQHAINIEDGAKPVVEHQRRLIPKMKDVVRNEFCDDLRSEAISRVHMMEKRARSYSYRAEPYVPEPYEPMEKDEYVPAEVFPEPRGKVSMIHKTSFSKREIKKFSREVKYAEVAMVDTPEFIDWSEQSISFDRTDHPKAVPRPGHAALVLEAQIGGFNMSKVFMDGGSGLNLLFANTMRAMGLTVDMLRESDTGFHGIIPTRPAYSLGKTSLDVVFGTPTNFRREKIEFEVVDWESQYHAILGRPAFAKFMAVPHYAYLKLKMPGNNGTPITIHGSFARSDTCDREFQKIASKFGAKEELNAIDAAVDHTQPPADNRNEGALIEFLRERWEIFAWEPSDMPGIPRELAEHALNVDPTAKPVQQSMRRFSEPKRRAIGEEINRLRKAGFIRELKESEWVANPVMVPKKDTTALRMCIDYTGLNKHCPKDHFPLPRIDQIVDSTAGCDRLSFLDAYSGYNQIKLKKEDQELTAFITPHGVFCYNVMTFGLKNAGATYQRCMQACL